MLLLTLADAALLLLLRTSAATAARRLPHLGAWLLRSGDDRVLEQLAAAGVWLAAAWLAAGLLTAFAAALPGTAGQMSAALCRVLLPAAARRLVAGTAGLGVLLAPAAALAHPAHPAIPASSASAPGGHASSAAPVSAAAPSVPGTPLPPPTWPTSHTPTSAANLPGTPTASHSPAQPPIAPISRRPPTHPAARPGTAGAAEAADTIRVRPGDCLWLLAARHLPSSASDAEIAAYWPRWYARNRSVIGAEPDLLRPGEVLEIPARPHPASK